MSRSRRGVPAAGAERVVWVLLAGVFALGSLPTGAGAYPLDGAARTGIQRLLGYRHAQEREKGPKLPPGALLGTADVHLHLADANPSWDPDRSPRDPALQAAVESVFAARDPSYAIAVIDITDPRHIAWAGLREDREQLPGSVGKLLCMIALFDGLRRAFPDTGERERILRERVFAAEDWTSGGFHAIPKYDPQTGLNSFSPIRPGERYRLSEWLDHAVSASANPAGSAVWKEAMLLRRFGSAYPPSVEQEHAFFRGTPKRELTALSQEIINDPLRAAGIDTDHIRQGSFWTRTGQARVPGISSFATPRELVRILLRIEQGRMVDRWSSLEMKRYLYMTKRRYRYVYAPELAGAAVYFKSGSYYQCAPEPGFECRKYHGNVRNLMNSVVIVESPARAGPHQRRYLVALMSNVLRVNSAWDHSRLGAAVEEAIRTRRPAAVREEGSARQRGDAGRSN